MIHSQILISRFCISLKNNQDTNRCCQIPVPNHFIFVSDSTRVMESFISEDFLVDYLLELLNLLCRISLRILCRNRKQLSCKFLRNIHPSDFVQNRLVENQLAPFLSSIEEMKDLKLCPDILLKFAHLFRAFHPSCKDAILKFQRVDNLVEVARNSCLDLAPEVSCFLECKPREHFLFCTCD